MAQNRFIWRCIATRLITKLGVKKQYFCEGRAFSGLYFPDLLLVGKAFYLVVAVFFFRQN